MFALNTATRITIALLTPFWWGMGLLVLALLGDVSLRWRGRVSRLFDRLERMRGEPPTSTRIPQRFAA
jgi:hypothetical protein